MWCNAIPVASGLQLRAEAIFSILNCCRGQLNRACRMKNSALTLRASMSQDSGKVHERGGMLASPGRAARGNSSPSSSPGGWVAPVRPQSKGERDARDVRSARGDAAADQGPGPRALLSPLLVYLEYFPIPGRTRIAHASARTAELRRLMWVLFFGFFTCARWGLHF